MTGRNAARVLAPVALIATAVALLMILASGGAGDGGATSGGEREAPQPTPTTQRKDGETGDGGQAGQKRPSRKTYRVQPGDTPSTIAEKAGIPLETLLDLNPDIDPQSLSPGQKLRLR